MISLGVRPLSIATLLIAAVCLASCDGPTEPVGPTAAVVPSVVPTASATPAPVPSRVIHVGRTLDTVGEPIQFADLSGGIVFDDFEDVYVMDVDGSNVVAVADEPGSEFDGALSPDGKWIVYRDSTRGINEDDEIAVVRTDGSDRRNITNDPANDWGPAWSPDGSMIAFNSDRDGGLRGYLVDPDGSDLRALDIEGWVEYPSFSPDGTRIAYMSHVGSDYDIFVVDLATGATQQLTDSPGSDGWPVWSPDGTTIAFTSERDDCAFSAIDQECWRVGPDDEHHDIWLMDADGSNPRRVTSEIGQFTAWSPDGRYLVISGHALFVVRPDGTGRLELRADSIDVPLGGIPDWR